MSWQDCGVLRSVTLGVASAVLAVACAVVETEPSPNPVQRDLAEWGQEFTPAPAPETGVRVIRQADVLEHLQGFPQDRVNRVANLPVFGTVRCVVPAKCPHALDGPPSLEPISVWLVEFPNVPRAEGGHAWAMVEAETGNMVFDSDTRPP